MAHARSRALQASMVCIGLLTCGGASADCRAGWQGCAGPRLQPRAPFYPGQPRPYQPARPGMPGRPPHPVGQSLQPQMPLNYPSSPQGQPFQQASGQPAYQPRNQGYPAQATQDRDPDAVQASRYMCRTQSGSCTVRVQGRCGCSFGDGVEYGRTN